MMKTFKILFLSSFVIITNLAFAQTYTGQISNASTIYNPSFVGSKNDLRIGVGSAYSSNSNSSGQNNTNSFLSIDAPIKKISAGIGANIIYNNSQEFRYPNKTGNFSQFSTLGLNLTYTQIITIRNKNKEEVISIRPGLTLNYHINSGSYIDTMKNLNMGNNYILTSLLLTGKKYFLGLKFNSYIITNTQYSFKYFSFLAGYTFQRKPESKFSFTPVIQFQNREIRDNSNKELYAKIYNILYNDITDLNFTFKYNKTLFGLNYNGIMLGYQTDKLRICLSGMKTSEQSRLELSLNYIFKKDKR